MSRRSDPVDHAAAASSPRVPDNHRIYAVGDVHGRLDLLEQLVALIRQDNGNREHACVTVVLLGDLIDRGPSSAELVRRCMALSRKSRQFVVLKGNHEAMMVDALRGNFLAFLLWMRSGGAAALLSWEVPEDLVEKGASPDLLRAARAHVPADVLAWLDRLPLTHRAGDYLFVHAGIRPGVAFAEQTPEDLMWIRSEFLDSDADHSAMIVHGHSISQDGIISLPNRIGIDTGAYRTEILTALALEADKRWTIATGTLAT